MMAGGSDSVETLSLSCVKCGKPAHLQCPKCVDLKLPRESAAFCTQDCFKASWGSHKSVHLKAKLLSLSPDIGGEQDAVSPTNGWLYCLKKGQSRTPKMPHFDWTGTLRPFPISKKRDVPAHIELPDWANDVSFSNFPVSSNNDYSHDDAVAWVSAAMASNRGCLDGLKEMGLSFHAQEAQNLTLLLVKALISVKEHGFTSWVPRTKSSKGDWEWELLASWNAESSKANIVVAQDGSGNYNTINQALIAIAAMGASRPKRTVIYVKSGVYNEDVLIGFELEDLMFVGDGIGRTIVTGHNNKVDGSSTLASATFAVYANRFWARDITFENTAGAVKGPASALAVLSDQSVFYRCSFRGYQDTLDVFQLRQYYRDCQIYGTIDFIFGYAAAVFQNCSIFVRKPLSYQSNVITAQGRENPNENIGISIMDSRVLPDYDFVPYKWSFKSYLGRPWKQYARVVFIRTYFDDLISPEGWGTWEGDFALSTLYFAECMNTGKGANTAYRVKWPGFHVVRNPLDIAAFSVRNLIQGHLWIPATGVPFSVDI